MSPALPFKGMKSCKRLSENKLSCLYVSEPQLFLLCFALFPVWISSSRKKDQSPYLCSDLHISLQK